MQLDIVDNSCEALLRLCSRPAMQVTRGQPNRAALQPHRRQSLNQAHIHEIYTQPEHGVLHLAHRRTQRGVVLQRGCRGLPAGRLLDIVLAELVGPRMLHHVLLVHEQVGQGLEAGQGAVQLGHSDLTQ